MQYLDTAKPATALHGEPAPGIVGSGGLNEQHNINLTARLQVARLVRFYAVNAAMAETIAPLVFLEAMQR